MSSRNEREKSSTNWWPKKKRKEKRVPSKVKEAWIKELVGDERMIRKKPSAWTSPPRIGMDKIRARTSISKYFIDFASSSTIHGLNHTVCPHRHTFERFLACVFILGALVSLILLSMNFWARYQNEPFIVSLDNDYRNFQIVRPAVLLCAIRKINSSAFSEVFERFGVADTMEARHFFTMLSGTGFYDYHRLPLYTGVSPDKWLAILYALKPDMVTESSDGNIGRWVVTGKGFCVSVNSYVSRYSSFDYWIHDNWTIVPTPEIVKYAYSDRENLQSVRVYLQNVTVLPYYPTETPQVGKPGIVVVVKQIVAITVLPREVATSQQVKQLSRRQRKCKLPEDKGLKMWPIYSQEMCTQECMFKAMLRVCECYPFYARPMPGIPVCTASQMHCIGKNRAVFMKVHNHGASMCDCVQNCDYAAYTAEIADNTMLKGGSPLISAVNMHIHFPPVIFRRQLQYGITDFITSVGGGAGLFLGASVISFIEIFYYATLRLYWYRRGIRKAKETKSRMGRVVPTPTKD